MSKDSDELEDGELPIRSLPNDGSFMEAFTSGSLTLHTITTGNKSEAGSGNNNPADAASIAPLAASSEQPTIPAVEKGNPMSIAAPTAQRKPAMILKSKRPIVNIKKPRLVMPSKRSKAAGGDEKTSEPGGKDSFYLREMERYRQQACDSNSGDRPLVK